MGKLKVIDLSTQFSFMSTVDLDARYFAGSLKNFAVRARVFVSPFRGNDNNESFFTQTSVS